MHSSGLNTVALNYLIRNRQTKEYFQRGSWTLDLGWAAEYSNVRQAITECLQHELRDVELVLQFGLEAGRPFSLQLSLPQQFELGRATA